MRARAAIVPGAGEAMEIRDFEVPEPGPGQFVLKVELTGMCGTDTHIHRGRLPGVTFPALLGHEIVGTLSALGPGLRTDHAGRPVAVGDRVGVLPALSCGVCFDCQVRHRPEACRDRRPSYGFASPVGEVPDLSGGFSEYLFASNVGSVFHRTELPPEIAVLQEPLSVALHGIDRGRVGIGATVVVQGVGAIGLMAVAAARAAGAARIVALGAPGTRLALARELGADDVVDITEHTDTAQLRRAVLTALGRPEGADCVLGTAGSPQAFTEAIGYLANGGVLAELGNFTDRGTIPFNPFSDLLRRDLTLTGVYGAGPEMRRRYHEALTLLERQDRPYERVVSHRVPLERVGEALAALDGSYSLDGRDVVKAAVAPAT
ncbi:MULTISPECIES: zinc-binding dehydrogenase [unclassified Streptomyces]|uniref:zinc-binding dehydrogenase n=1 Tax=unclassified Streptomyces TaxID=2593676 RepID=UPI00278C0FF9|nr:MULTISPECIES: zinc-binding dehydrogenase [unclassified Streptomyces]